MEQDYLTVTEPFETEFEIKKSRFIGRIYPIASEDDANAILSAVKKEHYKANHVCSAWVLHTTPERQKASDDGEPSGTAGKPILEVMNKRQIKDALVLVIRYFGGIKLGAGGLIRAYSATAAKVLSQCPIIKKQRSDLITIDIDYTSYGGLINLLAGDGYKPVNEAFGEKVSLSFEIEVAKTKAFLACVTEATNDRCHHTITQTRYVDIPFLN